MRVGMIVAAVALAASATAFAQTSRRSTQPAYLLPVDPNAPPTSEFLKPDSNINPLNVKKTTVGPTSPRRESQKAKSSKALYRSRGAYKRRKPTTKHRKLRKSSRKLRKSSRKLRKSSRKLRK